MTKCVEFDWRVPVPQVIFVRIVISFKLQHSYLNIGTKGTHRCLVMITSDFEFMANSFKNLVANIWLVLIFLTLILRLQKWPPDTFDREICSYLDQLLICAPPYYVMWAPKSPQNILKKTIWEKKVLQKTALSMVKSRLALGIPGRSFVCSLVAMLKMAEYTGKLLQPIFKTTLLPLQWLYFLGPRGPHGIPSLVRPLVS